jgi:putative transposase
MLYILALIYRNTKATSTELSECFNSVSHDSFTRLLHQRCCLQTLLWHLFCKRFIVGDGYLLLDDTVLDKFGQSIFGVYWVYSSKLRKTVQGINVVVLIWTDGTRRIPVGFKIWRKDSLSKVDLASRLLHRAKLLEITPLYVIFDGYYSAKKILLQLESYQWKYVTKLKKNRKFNGKQLQKHWPHRYGHATGKISGAIQVLIVKDGKRYLTTNDLSLSIVQVKAIYRVRQQIEEFFRVLQDQLRWGGSPARVRRAQVAHLYLAVMAYRVLEEEAIKEGTTIYRIRRRLRREEVPMQSQMFQPFIAPA